MAERRHEQARVKILISPVITSMKLYMHPIQSNKRFDARHAKPATHAPSLSLTEYMAREMETDLAAEGMHSARNSLGPGLGNRRTAFSYSISFSLLLKSSTNLSLKTTSLGHSLSEVEAEEQLMLRTLLPSE